MSLLKKPSDLHKDLKIKGLIYGQPGVGKTTLALSAPNPVIIDADKGIHRVESRYQVPSLPLDDYQDFLDLINSGDLTGFDTLVIDTLGELIERMVTYVGRKNSKAIRANGMPTISGWGELKIEFKNLLDKIEAQNMHLIFVAHEKESSVGDQTVIRPDVMGSSDKALIKRLDFVGYMEMVGGSRTVSFMPSERYYAKNSIQLNEVINIPDTEQGNTFIEQTVIAETKQRLKDDHEKSEDYDALTNRFDELIDAIETASDANEALAAIKDADHIWNSEKLAKKHLHHKVSEMSFTYDRDAGEFVANEE